MSGLQFNASPFQSSELQVSPQHHYQFNSISTANSADYLLNSDESSLYFQRVQETQRHISTDLSDIIEPQMIDYHYSHTKHSVGDLYGTVVSAGTSTLLSSAGSFCVEGSGLLDTNYTPVESDDGDLFSPGVLNNHQYINGHQHIIPMKEQYFELLQDNSGSYGEAFRDMSIFTTNSQTVSHLNNKKDEEDDSWRNPVLSPIESLSFDFPFLNKEKQDQVSRVNRRTESLILDGTKLSSLSASPTVVQQEITTSTNTRLGPRRLKSGLISNINTSSSSAGSLSSPFVKTEGFTSSSSSSSIFNDEFQTPSDLMSQSPGLSKPGSTASEFQFTKRPTLKKKRSSTNKVTKGRTTKAKTPKENLNTRTAKSSSPSSATNAATATSNKVKEDGSKDKEESKPPMKPLTEQLKEYPVIWDKVINNKKKGIYPCSHCRSTFTTLYELAEHIDEFKIHRKNKCPFKDCPWFVMGLTRRAEVRRHCAAQHNYLIVFPEDKRIAISNNCNSEQLAQGLRLHQHSGIQGTLLRGSKFPCHYEYCEREFKRKDAFQRHEKLVHLNSESRFNKRIEGLKVKYRTRDHDEISRILKILMDKKKKTSTNNANVETTTTTGERDLELEDS